MITLQYVHDQIEKQGPDYGRGILLARKLLLAVARQQWSEVALLEAELDADNDAMMDGYNDGFTELLDYNAVTVEAVINEIDRNMQKGVQ